MRTTINIKPVKVFTYTADKLIFQVTGISFSNQYADFHWELWSDKGGMLLQGSERLGGEEYLGWNEDLPYITDWLCGKLNVEELVPVTEDVVEKTVEDVPVTEDVDDSVEAGEPEVVGETEAEEIDPASTDDSGAL